MSYDVTRWHWQQWGETISIHSPLHQTGMHINPRGNHDAGIPSRQDKALARFLCAAADAANVLQPIWYVGYRDVQPVQVAWDPAIVETVGPTLDVRAGPYLSRFDAEYATSHGLPVPATVPALRLHSYAAHVLWQLGQRNLVDTLECADGPTTVVLRLAAPSPLDITAVTWLMNLSMLLGVYAQQTGFDGFAQAIDVTAVSFTAFKPEGWSSAS